VVSRARLFARLNPLHEGTGGEVDRAIALGAKALMLPYFRDAATVERFVALVDGRARAAVLVETGAALVRLREILAVAGIDEVMVGLTDLRLELRVGHHLELLVSPVMDAVAEAVHRAGLPLAVGGVAQPGAAGLPVDPDLVLAQYPRLGATGAWISRSFLAALPPGDQAMRDAVASLRKRLGDWSRCPPDELERAREALALALRAGRHG